MKFDLESLSWIGTTLAVFKRVGKVPVVKERLNKPASSSEMSLLRIFKTLGPVDLLRSREERINLISSLSVGERKNVSGFSFVR